MYDPKVPHVEPPAFPRAEPTSLSRHLQPLLQSLHAWSQLNTGMACFSFWVADAGDGLVAVGGDALVDPVALTLADTFWQGQTCSLPEGWDASVLVAGEQRLGVLVCRFVPGQESMGREFVAHTTTFLQRHLPDAMELERLHRSVERLARAERLQRALYRIADLASGERAMDQVLAEIHRIVAELTYAENFYIALYDPEHQLLSLPYFRDEQDHHAQAAGVFPASQWEGSLTLEVLRSGETLLGASRQLRQTRGLPEVGHGPQSEDWLGVPLLRAGIAVGVLVVQSYDPAHHYSDEDRALLTFVAQHVATALERLRAHEELELRVRERTEELHQANIKLQEQVLERERAEQLQRALFQIAQLGSIGGSLDEFYAAVHAVIGSLINARNFFIALLSQNRKQLEFPYSIDEFDARRPTRDLALGLTEYVLNSGRPLLADRAFIEAKEKIGELQSHGSRSVSWLGVPLIYDGHTVGVMATQCYDHSHRYTLRDQEILIFVSYHIANALQRKRQADSLREANATLERRVLERTEELASINAALRDQIAERERAEQRLRHAVLHDSLTGLPNRSLLLDRMSSVLMRYRNDPGAGFAVLFMDLDRFKVVNDSAGHLVGDELLKAVGARLKDQLPAAAMIARLGGDEFAVLLESVTSSRQATAIAARIIEAMETPLRIAGRDIYSSISIGIAFVQPHYRSAEELLRDADAALYRAKAMGRRRYEVFDTDLRRQLLVQVELDEGLRRALVRREFEPVFQPIFDLKADTVVGYEALLRWRHPQHGLLVPAHFLAQADETGLTESIDWQIYESAFAQAQDLLGPQAYLGINVGARHLRSPQFLETLLRRLDEVGLNPAQLRIEITESVLLEDPRQSRQLMEQMRDYGISIALDDFGTGYSSLSYLHQFPLQAIKIDRSFIEPLDQNVRSNAMTLLRAIHALGTQLGLEVIAEGIETLTQLEQVKSLGQGISGQGFLLARPASVHNLRSADLCGH